MNKISANLIRLASKLLKDVRKADKSDKITVFLGGQCDEDNSWRKEIKDYLKDRILYLDPFDKKWEASDNIYDELAGLLISDHVIFFKGGEGTKREKAFLDIVQPETEYAEFDNVEDLKQYLTNVTKGFKSKKAYDFSSVQCDMPGEVAEEVIDWGLKNIPEEALVEDGREDNIHVTVKYGLHGKDPGEVREFLKDQKPFKVTLGKVSLFQNDEQDVVKIEVDSPDLHKLNKVIADNFKVTDTFPEYIPHITVAYLKPGCGVKYNGCTDFKGKEVILNSVLFSGKDNRKTTMNLPKLASELDNLANEIEKQDPIVAKAIDQISDILEKTAKKWSGKVKPKTNVKDGIFTQSAETIAKYLLNKGGKGKAMSMLNFYINRAGENLTGERQKTLEDAKKLLQKKAFYSPMGWIPGRGVGLGNGWSAWQPGSKMQNPKAPHETFFKCQCGARIKQCGCSAKCPDCGKHMSPDVTARRSASVQGQHITKGEKSTNKDGKDD